MKKTLYIHIPFCRKKCHYCAFYSTSYRKELAAEYIDILCSQIKHLDDGFYTIYIGGGTPTILDISLWRRLLSALSKVSKKAREFTIEVNPESITSEKLGLFIDNGINRLSIGVQSFSQRNLKLLGRVHSVDRAIDSVKLAKKKGFSNISIDLIFGIWDQTLKVWENDLKLAVQLPITHISTYALSIEDRTAFSGKSSLDDDLAADMYEFSMDYLPGKGFRHYETSNFSKKGYSCLHNMHYWDNGASVGLGPSASSYYEKERFQNIADVREYIKRLKDSDDIVVFREKLSDLKSAKELAVLKLRTKEGIDFKDFKKSTGFELRNIEKEALNKLITKGLLRYRRKNGRIAGISLTKKGFLFSDTVSVELL